MNNQRHSTARRRFFLLLSRGFFIEVLFKQFYILTRETEYAVAVTPSASKTAFILQMRHKARETHAILFFMNQRSFALIVLFAIVHLLRLPL